MSLNYFYSNANSDGQPHQYYLLNTAQPPVYVYQQPQQQPQQQPPPPPQQQQQQTQQQPLVYQQPPYQPVEPPAVHYPQQHNPQQFQTSQPIYIPGALNSQYSSSQYPQYIFPTDSQFVNVDTGSPQHRRKYKPVDLLSPISPNSFAPKPRRNYFLGRPLSPPTAFGLSSSGVSKPHINVFETKTARSRRRICKAVADVKYPINYPVHFVPDNMRSATSLPGGAEVLPPMPEDITTRRYATGVDERNFLTVMEYEVNGQTIIWDYYTGYVHLTGLWKAVGHSKADIVRLLDYSPELEPLIKRVRGGFLKIQGTWVPYDVARKLATRVCFYIRFALVPLFGADFPESCMKPDKPGFGMLQMYYPSNAFTSRTGMSSMAALKKNVKNEKKHSIKDLYIAKDNVIDEATVHVPKQVPAPVPSPPFDSPNLEATANLEIPFVERKDSLDTVGSDDTSPPPLPRKVSYPTDVQETSEILAMLKATHSLQRLSTSKPIQDEPNPRRPTLTTILNT